MYARKRIQHEPEESIEDSVTRDIWHHSVEPSDASNPWDSIDYPTHKFMINSYTIKMQTVKVLTSLCRCTTDLHLFVCISG